MDWRINFFDDRYPELQDNEEEEDFETLVNLVMFPRAARIFRVRHDPFLVYDDKNFIDRFRLCKASVKFLVGKIGNEIRSRTTKNHAVTPELKVLYTLRYYATGNFLMTCGDLLGINKSTGCGIIRQVSRAIAHLRTEFINLPETEEERNIVAQGFHNLHKFPRCIGAIDCTHVKIRSPGGNDAEIFRNRKSFFSLNVQTVCDAQLRIQDIVARWPGSAHDSNIFRNSNVRARFERGDFGDFLLVGDSGYAVSNYLLTPVRNVVNRPQDLYNESLIVTRNTVERSYGVLKRRFPILATGVNVRKMETIQAIVVATAVLHNIAIFYGVRIPRVTSEQETAIRRSMIPAAPVADPVTGGRTINVNEIRRNQLIRYFQSRDDFVNAHR